VVDKSRQLLGLVTTGVRQKRKQTPTRTQELLRLVESILRYLDPDVAREVRGEHGLETPFEFLAPSLWPARTCWTGHRLGLKDAVSRLLKDRGFQVPVERVQFALVAQRALASDSKLAAEAWVADRVHIEGLSEVDRSTSTGRWTSCWRRTT
jgi:hypothetical protein